MSEAPEGAAEAVTDAIDAANPVSEEAVTETPAQGDEQSGDDAAAATDEPAPKPKKSAQERIDELTRARREAERDVEYWKAKAIQPAQQPAQEAQHEPQGDGRPDPADYTDDWQYIEALTDWKADRAAERLVQQTRQQEQARTVRSTFETRAKTLYPEGEPEGLAAFRSIPTLPQAVLEIVGESDIGPKIAEHLGDNPAELRRLQGLSPIQQARALTLIEARLTAPTAAPKATPKTATDAPEPTPQVRGSGGRFAVAADTDDFLAFTKQHLGT